jgi:hypothetical protein
MKYFVKLEVFADNGRTPITHADLKPPVGSECAMLRKFLQAG